MSPTPSALTPGPGLNLDSTIVAPATAAGPGARAVVRLSGREAWACVMRSIDASPPLPVRITRGCFSGELRLSGFASALPLDVLAWPAPRTYTGEDLVELHTLSSPPLLDALLAELLKQGCRLARPGEFTLRAFLAGKLDLTQAEAVRAVIEAGDRDELQTALAQLAGNLARPLHLLRDELLAVLAEVEAGLDFADEDLAFLSSAELSSRLGAARSQLEALLFQLERRSVRSRPFRVVLAGKPNTGKSSLFNALAGRPLALTSPEAGTTRDYLTARLSLEGVEIELFDTAGEDEAKGTDDLQSRVQNARREASKLADLVLMCVDASRPFSGVAAEQPSFSILTRCDLAAAATLPAGVLRTSAVTGEGLDELMRLLALRAHAAKRSAGLAPSWSRCREHVQTTLEHLEHAAAIVKQHEPAELLALELRLALEQLGEMVGAVYTDDLLDRIFSQFCIGK